MKTAYEGINVIKNPQHFKSGILTPNKIKTMRMKVDNEGTN